MRRSHLAALALLGSLVAIGTAGLRYPIAADHPIPEPLKQAPPSKFECRWADTPITIDGEANDPAWKLAETIDAFHLPWLGEKARMSRTRTTAKLLWDRDYLYFFADMEDSDLFADVTEHDGELWNNDVFELFFRPDAEKLGYYEFQVNAAGAKFDAFYPKYDIDKIVENSKKGKFHIDAKVKLQGKLRTKADAKRDEATKGWSVEGRIPWTDFSRTGGRPSIGETWKMNLCRFDYNKEWKEPELSCVAPIAKRRSGRSTTRARTTPASRSWKPTRRVSASRSVTRSRPAPSSASPIRRRPSVPSESCLATRPSSRFRSFAFPAPSKHCSSRSRERMAPRRCGGSR
ncbi:MAG: carbohydrate-binding family 9-like protein [Gemmataceae bacterium]